jgi:hypothetical protein
VGFVSFWNAVTLSLVAGACSPAATPVASAPRTAEAALAPLRCDSPNLRAEVDPEPADYQCVSSETTQRVGGRMLRSIQVSPDNCSEAAVTMILTNCTDERLVVSKARTSRDGVAESSYEFSDEAIVLPRETWRYRVFVGRDAGPIVTDVELLAPDGSTRHARALGTVRGVMTHYVN